MTDGPIRRAVKAVLRWHFSLNLRLDRARRHHREAPHWELGGACQLAARCCEHPAIQVGPLTFRLRSLRALFLAWQRMVNGFVLTDTDRGSRTFVFQCTHFDPATRRCDSYESRPGMCRDYPRAILDQANPELFPECGYRAVLRHAERFVAALDQQNLTPEQRAVLIERLRLRR